MSQFLSVFRYEFSMSVRRKGLWIAYLILFGFFGFVFVREGFDVSYTGGSPWQEAGTMVHMYNVLMPLIGGILAADRMQRDYRLGVRELQTSAPLSHTVYILGKYTGVLLSLLLPMLLWVLGLSVLAVALGLIGPAMIGATIVAFAAIAVPSFAFVTAFSLACPLVMPLRVYQILFTGYWFWGNFLNAQVFPTVSGTLLNSSGKYALEGFFQGTTSQNLDRPLHTPLEAWLNILVLGLSVTAVLFVLCQCLARQSKRT